MGNKEDATLTGGGVPFEYAGKTYQLGPFRLDDLKKYTAWLERQAWLSMDRLASAMSPAKYEAMMKRTEDSINSMDYSFGKPAFVKSIGSVEGLARMTLVALRVSLPDATEAFAAEMTAECFMNIDPATGGLVVDGDGDAVPSALVRAIRELLSDTKAIMARTWVSAGGAASPPPKP